MTCYAAFTTIADGPSVHALGEALEVLNPAPTGVGVFMIEDGSGRCEVAGYFVDRPDSIALDLLAAVHGARPFAVSKVDNTDWVAQVRRELSPVDAGRFVVFGSHDAESIPSNRIGLRIDAAMAFGTGHHGTTAGCLWEIDRLAREGFAPSQVVDIGTGTGVLAMAVAKVWPYAAVLATDIDQVAVSTAQANIAANSLRGRIVTARAAGLKSDLMRTRIPFDLVMANILARPLKRMADDIARATKPGGFVVLSGILNRQARGVVATFAGHGLHLMRQRRLDDWTTLTLVRA